MSQNTLKSISDLIETTLPIHSGKSGVLPERNNLVKFFVDNLKDKKGKPFKAKVIAIKLSHLNIQDLYYMQSIFKDIEHRNGNESAAKWFWWSLKCK